MVPASVLEQCKAGKESGYKTLYETCVRYVLSIVRSYIQDEGLHRDLVQDSFAQTFSKLASFDAEKGDFKFWLRKVTVNQCLMYIRKTNKFSNVIPIESYQEVAGDQQNSSRQYLEQLSETDIRQLLKEMPEGYKTVFLLIAIDDFKHEEVADLLDITPATSRSQYLKARRWIQQHIMTTNNAEKYGI